MLTELEAFELEQVNRLAAELHQAKRDCNAFKQRIRMKQHLAAAQIVESTEMEKAKTRALQAESDTLDVSLAQLRAQISMLSDELTLVDSAAAKADAREQEMNMLLLQSRGDSGGGDAVSEATLVSMGSPAPSSSSSRTSTGQRRSPPQQQRRLIMAGQHGAGSGGEEEEEAIAMQTLLTNDRLYYCLIAREPPALADWREFLHGDPLKKQVANARQLRQLGEWFQEQQQQQQQTRLPPIQRGEPPLPVRSKSSMW